MYKVYIVIITMLFPSLLFANTTLVCTSTVSTSIVMKKSNFSNKTRMLASSNNSVKPLTIRFKFDVDKSEFKIVGNVGEASLAPVGMNHHGDIYLIEQAMLGSMFLWIFSTSTNVLIQTKAYSLVSSPSTYTNAFVRSL